MSRDGSLHELLLTLKKICFQDKFVDQFRYRFTDTKLQELGTIQKVIYGRILVPRNGTCNSCALRLIILAVKEKVLQILSTSTKTRL